MGTYALTIPAILGLAALAPVVGARLFFLAPTKVGWIFYLSNVVGEFFVKKVGLDRFQVEAVLAVVGLLFLKVARADWVFVLLAAGVLAFVELEARRRENRLLKTTWTRLDTIGPRPNNADSAKSLARAYPSPSTHPELTVNLSGPFVRRSPRYCLGTMVLGREFPLRVLVGNHTTVSTQTAVRVDISPPPSIEVRGDQTVLTPVVRSGDVIDVTFLLAVVGRAGPQEIDIEVSWGDIGRRYRVHIARCMPREELRLSDAVITRYPGGCRSSFSWRGDMDLYDTSTFQSIEGLKVTLDLAARYRVPQTMYLSTRLALDETAARAWADHFGVDRGADEIPRFLSWFEKNVKLVHRASYPFESEKPYLMELGNHGHLHYGTDTSAALENEWSVRAKMGAGDYPWVGDDKSSFAEQRDNALKARQVCEEYFGFTPKSWAMPDRTRDDQTPRAMEAAGCEVLSDSDARTIDNVLLQPPPHFPAGCRSVELTKRYPGDPQHIYHVAMNLFWMHRAHRLGIPLVFMCHQHMRQYEGYGCARFTEAVLRHALSGFRGDLWIDTVFGVGTYWRDVLSDQGRVVNTRADNDVVVVTNGGDLAHMQVPVDVEFIGVGRATYLIDIAPDSESTVVL